MKLSEYLEANGIKRGEFAKSIGVTGGWITSLCDGSGWPSKEVAENIARATDGAVTANDFLVLDESVDEARA
jgi:3,4-dihydroxy 2-butanone 4-phosphate synthase / GTP cyclohydrolase II